MKDTSLYVFFLAPFLAFYLIMRFRIKTSSNSVCVIAATIIFCIVLLYGVFKYLQVEYIKQQYRKKLSKLTTNTKKKRVKNG